MPSLCLRASVVNKKMTNKTFGETMPDHWLTQPTAPLHDESGRRAHAHQQQLTKPPGSLGQLERLAEWLATRIAKGSPSNDEPR